MEKKENYGRLKSVTNEPECCEIGEIRLNDDRISHLKKQVFVHKNFEYNYYVDGNKDGPAIFTLPDVGMVPQYAFGLYFSLKVSKPILKEFCVYHIGYPGQEESDKRYETYPSFDEMAIAIYEFIKSTKKTASVGFGIGAGANLLIRAYLLDKSIFSRLIFINGYANSMSWSEWFNQKYSTFDITDTTITARTRSYLLYHMFGDVECNDYCYTYYNDYLDSIKHAQNLKLLLDSFATRSDVHIRKADSPLAIMDNSKTFKDTITCPVLLVVSEDMPHSDDCYCLKDLIDPTFVESVDFKDAHGFILNQYPLKITHAIVLFLQGLGYRILFLIFS